MPPGHVCGEALDVAIVGGGIIGITSALELLSRGLRVGVIDPSDPKRRSSYGNGGVISRGSIFPVAGPAIRKNLLKLALGRSREVKIRYRVLMRQLSWLRIFLDRCEEGSWWKAAGPLNDLQARAFDIHMTLAERIGTKHLITRPGWIKLYRNQASFEATELEREILAAKHVKTVVLDHSQLKELEPFISPRFSHGLWFPETGAVDGPDLVVQACHDAFLAGGGTLINGQAAEIQQGESQVTAVVNGRAIYAKQLILAAGAWSGEIAARLGYRVPFTAERGYHRHYENPAGGRLNRPVFDTGGGYALIPIKGSIRLFSGVEIARPDDAPDYAQIDSLVDDARATIRFGKPVDGTTWMGSRPSTPDGLPVIGRAPRHSRIVFAFGHGHIGFSTGPVTAQLVASIITDGAPLIDVKPFSLERFH